jgi:hypothetical protein
MVRPSARPPPTAYTLGVGAPASKVERLSRKNAQRKECISGACSGGTSVRHSLVTPLLVRGRRRRRRRLIFIIIMSRVSVVGVGSKHSRLRAIFPLLLPPDSPDSFVASPCPRVL